jgi:hypothetical protein
LEGEAVAESVKVRRWPLNLGGRAMVLIMGGVFWREW